VIKWLTIEQNYAYQITLQRLLPLGFLALILFLQLYLMFFFPGKVREKNGFHRLENWIISDGMTARTVFVDLIIIAALLVIASVAGQCIKYFTPYYAYLDFIIFEFYLESEMNIPTFFSVFLLLFSSVLILIPPRKIWQVKSKFVNSWTVLSFIFFILALDELLEFHEHLGEPIRTMFHTSGALFFAWYIPIIPVVIIIGLSYLKFLFSLPNKQKIGFMLSGFLYVFGAIGMEMIGSFYASSHGMGNFPYTIFATVEEFVEMGAVSLFIYFIWDFIRLSHQKNQLPE
jgi:hypothetical protein